MKFNKKWLQIGLLASLVIFLAACGNSNDMVSADSVNLWDRFVIYPLSQFIIWLSGIFGNNYALGIIVFTLIIRLLLFPVSKMQIKAQRDMQALQPALEAIKDKYPNRDRESMQLMQEEQQALMEANGVNQFAGCLPLVIQLPVMMALYQSILRTPELRQGHFLWTNLGQPDPYFILPILAALLTFANSYFMMKGQEKQNSQLKIMLYVLPLMILFISVGLPSALALYWVISNAINVLQTFMYNNPYQIIREREAKIQAEKDRQKALRKAMKRVKK